MKVLEIIKDDLENNIDKIKERAKNTKIIAVIKGNGYGLGLHELANFLVQKGISYLAVSSVEEAIELANIENINAKILCLESTAVQEELYELLNKDIIITIGSLEAANVLSKLAKKENKKVKVHLKIDTGFSRYGFLYNQKEIILKVIKENPSFLVEGIFSHFSNAYADNENYTKMQFYRFLSVKEFLEENGINIPIYHIANSSAFLKYDDMFLDAVRIGSAFLGRVIVENKIGLKRIGMLKSNVVEIKELKKGTKIGYSNSYTLKRNSQIAVVPVGYSDGFHVAVKNDTFKFVDRLRILKNSFMNVFKKDGINVYIKNLKYPVIGKVGMNHIVVDITDSDVKINDEVRMDISPVLVSSKIRREYI